MLPADNRLRFCPTTSLWLDKVGANACGGDDYRMISQKQTALLPEQSSEEVQREWPLLGVVVDSRFGLLMIKSGEFGSTARSPARRILHKSARRNSIGYRYRHLVQLSSNRGLGYSTAPGPIAGTVKRMIATAAPIGGSHAGRRCDGERNATSGIEWHHAGRMRRSALIVRERRRFNARAAVYRMRPPD